MEGQPISVEALERPVEENRPQPNPVEGAGTGPLAQNRCLTTAAMLRIPGQRSGAGRPIDLVWEGGRAG